jgi:hypothetical protein
MYHKGENDEGEKGDFLKGEGGGCTLCSLVRGSTSVMAGVEHCEARCRYFVIEAELEQRRQRDADTMLPVILWLLPHNNTEIQYKAAGSFVCCCMCDIFQAFIAIIDYKKHFLIELFSSC